MYTFIDMFWSKDSEYILRTHASFCCGLWFHFIMHDSKHVANVTLHVATINSCLTIYCFLWSLNTQLCPAELCSIYSGIIYSCKHLCVQRMGTDGRVDYDTYICMLNDCCWTARNVGCCCKIVATCLHLSLYCGTGESIVDMSSAIATVVFIFMCMWNYFHMHVECIYIQYLYITTDSMYQHVLCICTV